ncbi:MAG: hypothetical protein Fur0021_03860 [Candidatus Promineifilaceae bacterium]
MTTIERFPHQAKQMTFVMQAAPRSFAMTSGTICQPALRNLVMPNPEPADGDGLRNPYPLHLLAP